ncbi:Glu/Leu/Phe/Val dehydrogenase dimerization domain-containing protein [Pseudonocardia spinosispora]|uniref:Glu/Leu/Phe/Val dehydrogenase dimerization domain-containing protein n=1 Tax=Pseudonocardia spinosispora TaxID=103441 RepID=UPI0004218F72|nr:Glu/Leu/Phe/Val dehydrogenase dimerization domain-containing protein [Pseudonocardia spinosispora]
MTLNHEQVRIVLGARSGVPIIVAIHSTERGKALGGCRLWHYPDWRDGLADALRLAEGMTAKNAAAGLQHGGGKTVVALPAGFVLDAQARREVMLDVGDLIESFDGSYATGPDVGTTPEDMAVIGERTGEVFCRPEAAGGSGDCSPYTAIGVLAAMRAVCGELDGSTELRGRRVTVVGLGHVGTPLVRALHADGAVLTVTDIDPARRALAAALGATWVDIDRAPTVPADILVPAALGGLLTRELVPHLRCRGIVGPANNQLAEPEVARLLSARGIIWATDHLASAGGVVYAVARELHGVDHQQALERVLSIEDTVRSQLRSVHTRGQVA